MNKPAQVTLHVPLTEDQLAQLEGIAAASNETAADVAARAVADYLTGVDDYRTFVEAGETDVREGRTRPWDDVEAELDAKFGPFDD